MLRPLNPKTMISVPIESPQNVEFAVAQRRRSEEDCGESGQQIGVGRARRAAAEARGEKRAGQRRAHAGDDEAEDLDAVNAYAGKARGRLIAADGLNFLADRRPLDQDPKAPATTSAMTMIGLGMPNSQRPRASLQEGFRHARDDRHAGRIGERQADEDRADAERRDDGIHPAAW